MDKWNTNTKLEKLDDELTLDDLRKQKPTDRRGRRRVAQAITRISRKESK